MFDMDYGLVCRKCWKKSLGEMNNLIKKETENRREWEVSKK